MAMRVETVQVGVKETLQQIDEMMAGGPPVLTKYINEWWDDVVDTAKMLCPRDTGALAQSIRIVTGEVNTSNYEVARGLQDGITEAYIVAGGGGFINPKKNKEVDYAQAVHDGSPTNEPNPFLDRAMSLHMGHFDTQVTNAYSEWMGKKWEENQPTLGKAMADFRSGLGSLFGRLFGGD